MSSRLVTTRAAVPRATDVDATTSARRSSLRPATTRAVVPRATDVAETTSVRRKVMSTRASWKGVTVKGAWDGGG
ncbi:hypothetical protein B0I35DRAFT_423875, partial [Stachybotrys elegans]